MKRKKHPVSKSFCCLPFPPSAGTTFIQHFNYSNPLIMIIIIIIVIPVISAVLVLYTSVLHC